MYKILCLLILSGCALDLSKLQPEDAGQEDSDVVDAWVEDDAPDARREDADSSVEDTGIDSDYDAGEDAGEDSGVDSGHDAGYDSGAGCPCSGSLTCCEGRCVDLQTDSANCGSCGNVCGANRTCTASYCMCGDLLCRPDFGCECSAALTCSGSSDVCRIGG